MSLVLFHSFGNIGNLKQSSTIKHNQSMQPGWQKEKKQDCFQKFEMPRFRLEVNISMELQEIFVNMRNWIDSAQDKDCWSALVNAAFNLRA